MERRGELKISRQVNKDHIFAINFAIIDPEHFLVPATGKGFVQHSCSLGETPLQVVKTQKQQILHSGRGVMRVEG